MGMIGAGLLRLAALLARRHGRTAVALLLFTGRAWLADPNNDRKRRELVEQLRGWSRVAGDRAGKSAARLAHEVERRRITVSTWERELMTLRYELVDLEAGDVREAALEAYVAQLAAAPTLVRSAVRPSRERRRVLAVLGAEAAMLRGDRLTGLERERTLEATERARAASYLPARGEVAEAG